MYLHGEAVYYVLVCGEMKTKENNEKKKKNRMKPATGSEKIYAWRSQSTRVPTYLLDNCVLPTHT